jgi:hypothetical protein
MQLTCQQQLLHWLSPHGTQPGILLPCWWSHCHAHASGEQSNRSHVQLAWKQQVTSAVAVAVGASNWSLLHCCCSANDKVTASRMRNGSSIRYRGSVRIPTQLLNARQLLHPMQLPSRPAVSKPSLSPCRQCCCYQGAAVVPVAPAARL